jgi:uncharacterized protein (TIGR02271 family)
LSDSTDSDRSAQSTSVDSRQLAADQSADLKHLNLLAEELHVGKETVETGRLRLSKQTHTREAVVDENLLREQAEIERVPIGRQIFEMPPIRQEGETMIVPIVEEVLFTERRLMLKEELRVTRRRTTERFQDTVRLRYQEAVITRVQSATDQADATSGTNVNLTDIKE